jgi:hypothetical protein
MLRPIPLQRTEVVRVAQFRPQCLEDVPIVLLAIMSELSVHVPHQIGHDAIVVEERVIDVEQGDKRLHRTSVFGPLTSDL